MNKLLLLGLDGLRPDFVTDALMPNLTALTLQGTLFRHHRAVFPSETYVNLASIVTGVWPGRHGIVANEFFDPAMGMNQPWAGNRIELVEAAIRACRGGLMTAAALGDHLARAGKSLSILSGNSAGSARQMHPRVDEARHHALFIGQDWRATIPRGMAKGITSALGEPPSLSADGSSMALQSYLVDAFLSGARTSPLPDVTILWLGEPDTSLHAFGLGGKRIQHTLRELDRAVGRIADWWESRRDDVTLLVMSDHGHITQTRRTDIAGALQAAGFTTGTDLSADPDIALVAGYTGNLRVRGRDSSLLRDVSQALMAWSDTGLLFTRGDEDGEGAVPGTLPLNIVRLEHPRSPDLVFTLRTTDDADAFGNIGTCLFDGAAPAGTGYHGGLHPNELSAFLTGAGPRFPVGAATDAPTSALDILPTILSTVGLDPTGLEGANLALLANDPGPDVSEARQLEVSFGNYRQRLATTSFRSQLYLEGGWRGDARIPDLQIE